jgi:ELWxxDGT repeat protein
VLLFPAAGGIWKSDGTTGGTVLMKPSVSGSLIDSESVIVGHTLFFNGYTLGAAADGRGSELWRTDGTSEGTFRVADIYPGASSSSPWDFVRSAETIYFKAYAADIGASLWRSDGTAEGTTLISDLDATKTTYSSLTVATAAGSVFFAVNDGVRGSELWKTDPVTGAAVLVKDIAGGTADGIDGSTVTSFAEVNGNVYFQASDGVTGLELWKTDGTPSGTLLVKDIRPGSEGSNPKSLIAVGDILYFFANDGVSGQELWRSDGTSDGTYLVKDIHVGSSVTGSLVGIGDEIYFSASDDLTGFELWKSDGTSTGTVRVADIVPNKGSSFPGNLGLVEQSLETPRR